MTGNKIPPDWVLIEAAKRCGWPQSTPLEAEYADDIAYRALCDMIAKYEQPPVDRKLLCAREATAEAVITISSKRSARFRSGEYDDTDHIKIPLRAASLRALAEECGE